jgi:hypothetical protein
MTNIAISESICLSSEEVDDERPVEQTTNSRFEQKGLFGSCEARFRVFNDHYIEVKTSGLFKRDCEYELDCTFLDPRPVRVLRIDWWSGGLFLVLVACLAAVAWRMPELSAPPASIWLAVTALVIAAALALGTCLYRSSDRIIFYTRHGRAPLLKLLNRRPAPDQLESFVADIARRIERAKRQDDSEEFLSDELREHRRLKEQGVLTEQGYEVVKRRLLRAHRSR